MNPLGVKELLFVLLFLVNTLLLVFAIVSANEKERKAVRRGSVLLLLSILFSIILFQLPDSVQLAVFVALLLLMVLLLLKFGNKSYLIQQPESRFDERDVMFSRSNLQPGSQHFHDYYRMRPQNKATDEEFRKEPGLLSEQAVMHNELLFQAAKASFRSIDLLQPAAEGPVLSLPGHNSPENLPEFLMIWTKKLGAHSVGFTQLKETHYYSHKGRGEAYGKPISAHLSYAIAFTVEMSHKSLQYNPQAPVVMESAQQYMEAAKIAIQLASFLRQLGYEARAHIDANYTLICPPVAMEAGLGTIGRMGLLMTPDLGPRVRIGVVSTNLEFPVMEKQPDFNYMIDFCNRCKKCADNCPSQAIPKYELRADVKQPRWQINHEKCFSLWCKLGTDCGRCVAVCPFSHPNNYLHRGARYLIRRNPMNRKMMLWMDDFFYGRRPAAKRLRFPLDI